MNETTDIAWYSDLANDVDYLVEDIKIGFAVDLERRMRQLGMSKADLARELETSSAYITKILRGDSNLTIRSMVFLANAVDGSLNLHIAPRDARVRWFEVISGARQMPDISVREAALWARSASKEPHGHLSIAA